MNQSTLQTELERETDTKRMKTKAKFKSKRRVDAVSGGRELTCRNPYRYVPAYYAVVGGKAQAYMHR